MMQMPSNSFLGHPALQSNYQSMMIGTEPQRLLPSWNYPPPPPPPPPPTHAAASAGSTSAFNCLPIDRPSSNDEKSIQGPTQHQQLASSSSPSSSISFTGGYRCQTTSRLFYFSLYTEIFYLLYLKTLYCLLFYFYFQCLQLFW